MTMKFNITNIERINQKITALTIAMNEDLTIRGVLSGMRGKQKPVITNRIKRSSEGKL